MRGIVGLGEREAVFWAEGYGADQSKWKVAVKHKDAEESKNGAGVQS